MAIDKNKTHAIPGLGLACADILVCFSEGFRALHEKRSLV